MSHRVGWLRVTLAPRAAAPPAVPFSFAIGGLRHDRPGALDRDHQLIQCPPRPPARAPAALGLRPCPAAIAQHRGGLRRGGLRRGLRATPACRRCLPDQSQPTNGFSSNALHGALKQIQSCRFVLKAPILSFYAAVLLYVEPDEAYKPILCHAGGDLAERSDFSD